MRILELTVPPATELATIIEGDEWDYSSLPITAEFPPLTGGRFRIMPRDDIYMVLNAANRFEAAARMSSPADWSNEGGQGRLLIAGGTIFELNLKTTKVKRIDLQAVKKVKVTTFVIFSDGSYQAAQET